MEENLFDLLLAEYVKTDPPEGMKGIDELHIQFVARKNFIDFAKAYLKKNGPVGTATVDYGLAIRLQQGQVVTLVERKKEPENPIRGVFVTNPGINPAMHGITSIDSVPVTDPNR